MSASMPNRATSDGTALSTTPGAAPCDQSVERIAVCDGGEKTGQLLVFAVAVDRDLLDEPVELVGRRAVHRASRYAAS